MLKKAFKDFKELEQFMQKKTGNPQAKLKAWDIGYYCKQLKK